MKELTVEELHELTSTFKENAADNCIEDFAQYKYWWILSVIRELERLRKRNAVLEAAVAWHGFDEEPMPLKGLEKLPRNHRHVRVVEFYAVQDAWGYEKKQIFKAEYHFSTEAFTVKGCTHSNGLPEIYRRCCKKAGHIGWRYPVGDLSE